jgi:hypothetical protein
VEREGGRGGIALKKNNYNIWIITNNLYTVEQVSHAIYVLETSGKTKN